MRLREKEKCPIHNSRTCCGRERIGDKFPDHLRYPKPVPNLKWKYIAPGVRWFRESGREVCSPAAMKVRKHQLLRADPTCFACGGKFTDYNEVELSHRISKGMGGSKRDDRMENLVLLHKSANRDQGSMDLDTYLATKWKREVCEREL